jgi:hypothetical protein
MRNVMKNLWNDEGGFIISAELILVSTILVVGLIVGLVELQSAVIHELNDVGEAIGSLNQSYSFAGANTWKGGHVILTAGSAFYDSMDCACCDCNQGASFFCTAASAKEGVGGGYGAAVFGAPAGPAVIGGGSTHVVPSAPVIVPPQTSPPRIVVPTLPAPAAECLTCPPVGNVTTTPIPQAVPHAVPQSVLHAAPAAPAITAPK